MSDWSFYDRGFSLFPLTPKTKSPALKWEPYQTQRAQPAQIEAWRKYPSNTGVATGAVSNCIVLDADNLMARMEAEGRGIPDTLTVSTPRGTHFYFNHPGWGVKNRAGRGWTINRGAPGDTGVDGWDLRGDGGYVVGPGSHYVPTVAELAAGKVEGVYSIERDLPMADAPDWLLALTLPRIHRPNVEQHFSDQTTDYGRAALNSEIKVLVNTPGGGLNQQINASAFAVGQLVGGGQICANEALDALQKALDALSIGDEEKALGTVERGYAAGLLVPRSVEPKSAAVTPEQALGTRSHVPAPPPPVEGSMRSFALTQAQLDDKNNHLAVEYWFAAAGFRASYDEFSDRELLNGEPITDRTERAAWLAVRELCGLKISKELFGDVVRYIAWANRFHPLRDWLASVEPSWDGVPRLGSWLTNYLGVEPSPYTAAIGEIFLTAAVRRARHPGSKFDEIIVLEGPQGVEKSTAISCLCPLLAWFCDDFNVSMGSRELLEATEGKWLVEAPELSKLNTSEVEHVKHMLSRRVDRARKAYDRSVTERGRQWVGFATTNADQYLTDPTGNRRFWPAKVGVIDLAAILRDRDQLWAEACQRETAGGSIRLGKALWGAAAVEQEQRVVVDPFMEILHPILAPYANGRLRAEDLWHCLAVPIDRRQALGRKLGDAMRSLGWVRRRARDGEKLGYFYFKGFEAPEIFWDIGTRKFINERPKLSVVPG